MAIFRRRSTPASTLGAASFVLAATILRLTAYALWARAGVFARLDPLQAQTVGTIVYGVGAAFLFVGAADLVRATGRGRTLGLFAAGSLLAADLLGGFEPLDEQSAWAIACLVLAGVGSLVATLQASMGRRARRGTPDPSPDDAAHHPEDTE